MAGWVKLHRTITDSFVFQNPDRLKFWVWCLCKASHKDRKQSVGLQEVNLTKGQFIFGRKKASSELNMDESKIYRLLKTFEKREKIEVKSNNKFSVVTIVNWSVYQDEEQQSEQQSNNKLTTNEQQMNTNKNVKKEKNVNNVKKKEYTLLEIAIEEFKKHRKMLKKPMTDLAVTKLKNKLDTFTNDDDIKIQILEQSILNGWQGVFELKAQNKTKPKSNFNDEFKENLENGPLRDFLERDD